MALQEIFVKFRTNVTQFSKQLFQNEESFKKLKNRTGELSKAYGRNATMGAKLGRNTRMLLTGFKGFRMEMLSVMFGAQMVSKALWGLLKPAMEVTGIFELFTAMLQILFLPVALWLLENVFIPLFDIFTALPEPMQKAIGFFILFAAVFFSILATGAALIIFFGGLVSTISFIAPMIAGIGTVLGTIVGIFALVFAAILLIILGFVLAWKENFGGIREWTEVLLEGIKVMWDGLKDYFSGLWDLIKGVFSGDEDLIKQGQEKMIMGLKKLWEGFKSFFVGLLVVLGLSILKFGVTIGTGIHNSITFMLNTVIDALNWLLGQVNKLTGKIGINIPEIGKLGMIKSSASRQTGGYIPHDGLYKLHAGETVQQSNTSSFSPNVVVNASSNVDIDMLKSQLSDQWSEELDRLSRR